MLEPLIRQAGRLPSLPEIYVRVTELLKTEDSTAKEIGDALQTDPNLTARILKVINSAYFGLRNPVTSIPQVVGLLGREQLQQVVLGSVLSGVFKNFDITDFPMRDFWQHSIKAALIGRQLAMQNPRILDHEAFFTIGLLHDIGWLVVANVAPGSFSKVSRLAKQENRNILDIEREILGVTHVEVSVSLLQKWGLPEIIVECVKHHHDDSAVSEHLVETKIVHLTNQLCGLNLAQEVTLEDLEQEITDLLPSIPNWELTQCSAEQIAIACQLASRQWREVMELLGIDELVAKCEDDGEFSFITEQLGEPITEIA